MTRAIADTTQKRGGDSSINPATTDPIELVQTRIGGAQTVRGSIAGNSKDLQESLECAGESKVQAHCSMEYLTTPCHL